MFSFILPAYKAAFLKEAIESIINQSINDWELVVVNDASPEDLQSIVEPYCKRHSNIKYYCNERNIGGTDLVAQWNHCLSFASGEWIILASDDDVYHPTFCEKMKEHQLQHPDVELMRARLLQIDEKGKELYREPEYNTITSKYEYLYNWLTANYCTCIGNYIFKHDSLKKLGGFIYFPCAFGSDIATPVALSQNGVINSEEFLYSYRISPVHLSSDIRRYPEKLKATTQLYQWLSDLNYEKPNNEEDKKYYAIINRDYFHRKCIYDYFHCNIINVPFSKLHYIRYCESASLVEKAIILARWIKNLITK